MNHPLHRRLPLLLDYPSRRDSARGICYGILLAVFAVVSLAAAHLFSDSRLFFSLSFALLLLHVYLMSQCGGNILFLFRYSLLVAIPIGAAAAWGFFTDVLIAPFGAHYQTYEATVALVVSGMLAAAGGSIGWFLVFLKLDMTTVSSGLPPNLQNLITLRKISLTLLYGFGLLTLYSLGGFVTSSKTYAQGSGDLGFEFGASNAFIFLLTAFILVTSFLLDKTYNKTFLLIAPVYILPILAGSRADFLMQLSILVFVSLHYRLTQSRQTNRFPILLVAISALALFLISTFIAIWRSVGDLSRAFDLFLQSPLFIAERSAGNVLLLETGNQMAAHFYVVYSKLELLHEPYLLGSSYFDFLLRTPPGFFGLPRPQDLSWLMYVYDGEVMAQGGIYEVAEAYWNFGFIGALFVPLLISYVIGSFLRQGLTSQRHWIFFSSAFIGLSLMAPRGVWYQTFAYFRVLTVIALLFYIFRLLKINLVRVR